MDWLDLLAVQGTLKSLLQHLSSKASILWCSAFFTVQLPHPYMTTGKTIALTRWTFVGKVADRRVPAELGQESQASSCLRKGTPLASRVAQGVSGPSSSCLWNPRVFADDARGWQCPFVLCLHPQGCLRRGVRASGQEYWSGVPLPSPYYVSRDIKNVFIFPLELLYPIKFALVHRQSFLSLLLSLSLILII